MPQYLRAKLDGGTFFFTVTLADRSSNLLVQEIDLFREAYRSVRRRLTFATVAICILPEHLHAIWSLPEGDVDYSKRWNLIKGGFSRYLPASVIRSRSKIAKRERASGNVAIGSMRSAMKLIWCAMSTTSISTPSSTAWFREFAIGRTVVFTALSNAVTCRSIGAATRMPCHQERSANEMVGTALRAFAHPTSDAIST